MVEKEEVFQVLKQIIDPHTSQSVYEMGLIEELEIDGKVVSFVFRPSSPFCPLGVQLARSVKEKVQSLQGVSDVKVKVKGHVQEKQITRQLCE